MRVTLDDTILDAYQAMADAQGRSLESVLNAQLKRFNKLPPGTAAVVVKADALKGLEKRLGDYAIKDGEDLLARVQKLAGVSFEGRDIKLSVQQMQELEHRAKRQGKPVAQLLDEMAARFMADFFYSAGGGEAQAPLQKVG